MTDHGRKFRDGRSHVLPLWSGILEHRKRLGVAIYEFIWCIDKITKEKPTEDGEGSDGLVLGGAPVKIKDIAKDLEEDYRTARRNMDLLVSENYIARKRTPYGFSIRVHNSKKFKIWGWGVDINVQSTVQESGQKCPVSVVESGHKCPQRVDRSVRNKEDHAVDHAVRRDAAVRAACPVWKETGVDPLKLPGPFVKLCEDFWPTRNGASLFEFMGTILDAWQTLGGTRYPPAWVKRKSELGRSTPARQEPERPELEPIPWQK